MPRVIFFNNRQIIEPGVYTQTQGGVESSPISEDTGAVLIIDTGAGAGFGGGSGISGELQSGINSIYEFVDYDSLKMFAVGGILVDAARWLFNPALEQPGASRVLFVRAAATTAAEVEVVLTNGTLAVSALNEGLVGNGVLNDDVLSKGFAVKMRAGSNDSSAFVFQFYQGTYAGANAEGVHWSEAPSDSFVRLLVESPEVADLTALEAWMESNSLFKSYFEGDVSGLTGQGTITALDLDNNDTLQLFAGGTESYTAGAFTAVLEAIAELDFTFILSDKYGVTDGKGATNDALLTHINTEATYDKFLVVGGGEDDTEFDQAASSVDVANHFNSARVFVVHSAIKVPLRNGGFRTLTQLHHAAAFLGRVAGLAPQEPATWKNLSAVPVHQMTKKQRGVALLNGVNHLRKVGNAFVINQEVTSLSQNDEYIYPDGSSPEGSVMRIISALNKFVVQNTEPKIIGGNVNTSGPAEIIATIEGLLKQRLAKLPDGDDLIISFREVRATLNGSDATATYKFVPNGPVNRLFITSIVLQPAL